MPFESSFLKERENESVRRDKSRIENSSHKKFFFRALKAQFLLLT
jgi:hypothetical protein